MSTNLTKATEWLNRIQKKLAEVQEMIQEEISSDVLNQNWVEIPDANFRDFLKQSYPTCFNSQGMMDTTCSAVLTARKMYCSDRNIASLEGIQYFKGLTILYCSENELTSLPALPSGLTTLSCSHNQLTSLPALPSGLERLWCHFNELTSLPELPSTLIWLDCYNNSLTNPPVLPSRIKYYNGECNNY
jgi:hypothetical protein